MITKTDKTTKANKFGKLADSPSFEEILIYLNGRKERLLLKNMVRDDEGNVVKWGTNRGELLYVKLVNLLHGIGQLTGLENNVAEIVRYLDFIAESGEYI